MNSELKEQLAPFDRDYPVALWDLDSSLCDTQHRHWIIPLIKQKQKNWDDYSMLCDGDAPIPGPVTIMRELDNHWNFALSGRAECARERTVEWAQKHAVPLNSFILRPTGSRLNIGVWKVSKIRYLMTLGFTITFMAEDNAEIARRIHEETGVTILGLNPFYANDHTMFGAV